MEQVTLKVGRCFALISKQWGVSDLFVTGRSHFLLSERSLSFNNAMITLTSARWSACIVELVSGILFISLQATSLFKLAKMIFIDVCVNVIDDVVQKVQRHLDLIKPHAVR